MKKFTSLSRAGRYLLMAIFLFIQLAGVAQVKNVVLVHGSYADGSGWQGVYEILTKKGYNVTIVQNPLTSFADDVASVKRVLDRLEGPVVLVGHSYGGVIITEAGNLPKVTSLVYVAAFQPDAGENVVDLNGWAPPAPENGIILPDSTGFSYYDKAKFHAGFCADLPKAQADFMFASQGAMSASGFITRVSKAAWKSKPSWAIVATEDKSINPEIERKMYARSGAKVTEIKGSHVVFISQPKAVAAVIEAAAAGL